MSEERNMSTANLLVVNYEGKMYKIKSFDSDYLPKTMKVQVQNSAFSNGRSRALTAIQNKAAAVGIKIENVMKIRPDGSKFKVIDGGKDLKTGMTYDEAVKFMTSRHSAQQESQDWHDDQKTFGASDARRRMGR